MKQFDANKYKHDPELFKIFDDLNKSITIRNLYGIWMLQVELDLYDHEYRTYKAMYDLGFVGETT